MSSAAVAECLDNDQEYEYSLFSLEALDEIEAICLFLDKNNNIKHLKQDTLSLATSNKITKDELDDYIQRNVVEMRNTYRITSLCLFKIDIHSDQVLDYINNVDENSHIKNIKQFSKIEDINFTDSLIMFHDINSF